MPNRRAHDHLTDHNWILEIEGTWAGVARVPLHTPDWTDLNDSDPGVSADTPNSDAATDILLG
jgi:hypothetical protein